MTVTFLQGFGAGPFGAALAPGIFLSRAGSGPGKREHDFGIFEN